MRLLQQNAYIQAHRSRGVCVAARTHVSCNSAAGWWLPVAPVTEVDVESRPACVGAQTAAPEQSNVGDSRTAGTHHNARTLSYSTAATNEWFSTRVLVNTESTLIQAANDDEGVVGQRTCGPKSQGLEQACIYNQVNVQAGKLQMKLRIPKFS